MDNQTTKEVKLPFNNAAVVSIALQGGWTVLKPSTGELRDPATHLYVAASSVDGNENSGVYKYDLKNKGWKNPKQVIKGSVSGLGIDNKGQQIITSTQGSSKVNLSSLAGS